MIDLNNPLPIFCALIKEHPELHMQEYHLQKSYFPPLVSAVLPEWQYYFLCQNPVCVGASRKQICPSFNNIQNVINKVIKK